VVPCDGRSSGNGAGLCVSGEVDPSTGDSEGGCRVSGDDAPPSAVDLDASTAGDASADASFEASVTGDGGDASDGDAGPGTPGYVDCPGAPGGRCATAGNTFCCWNYSTGTGECMTGTGACYTSGKTVISCDDRSDCAAGEVCCNAAAPALNCTATQSCISPYPEICHGGSVCGGNKACIGKVFNHYESCQ